MPRQSFCTLRQLAIRMKLYNPKTGRRFGRKKKKRLALKEGG